MQIEKVKFEDAIPVKKMLLQSNGIVNKSKLLQEILSHIENEDSVYMKIVDKENNILGVWLSKEFEKHTSLSYFYISEEIRTMLIVIIFVKECLSNINRDKPIIITTKDTTGFDRYVEKINDTQYLFKGFR